MKVCMKCKQRYANTDVCPNCGSTKAKIEP